MIRLNRTTEYALIALRHLSQKQAASDAPSASVCSVTSAREISDTYGLPFEITAKTLQRLKDLGLIRSAQGARGGYTLQRALHEVNLAQFMEWMEGPQGVVGCLESSSEGKAGTAQTSSCGYGSRCEIQNVMGDLNARILKFLAGIPLAEVAGTGSAAPRLFQIDSHFVPPHSEVSSAAAVFEEP